MATRHGFGYIFRRGLLRPHPDGESPGARATRGRRLREMFEELGPTFVKFGQLLSTRPDLLPADVITELRKLQGAVRPFPFDQVRMVVEADLGLTIEQAFESFEDVPIGAASIGQVHAAVLPGGQAVVVKVQRPDAADTLAADIDLLRHIARLARNRVKRLAFIDLPGLVDEFAHTVREELDYRNEARYDEAVRRNFAGSPNVTVPLIYWRRTTKRVLTMQRLDGHTLAQVDLGEMSGDDRRTLAARIAETWMQMVFGDGLFHGDPHPANIIVLGPDHIGLVDFGMVGSLSTTDREAAVRLFGDILDQNADRIPRDLKALGVRYPRELEEEFRDRLAMVVSHFDGAAMDEIDPREILHEIFGIIYELQITLPSRWILLDKTLATLAGVAQEIAPDFNVFETARPYARRLFLARFSPDRIAGRVQGDVGRYASTFLEYPFQLANLFDELKNGDLRVGIDIAEIRDASHKGMVAANRVAIALVAAAVFLGSAIVGTFVQDGPHIFGLALIGVPGFLMGLGLFGWLVVGMIRSGHW